MPFRAAHQLKRRRQASQALTAIVDAVATSPLVDRVVDTQVDRILPPLVAGVLDDVLAQLEAEPDRVRPLIRGQRENMVDELVTRVRSGAAVGDTAVDRFTTRLFRRAPTPPPAGPV